MTKDNPPLALPNDQVYSKEGIEMLTVKSANGKIVCPATNAEFKADRVSKVFLIS